MIELPIIGNEDWTLTKDGWTIIENICGITATNKDKQFTILYNDISMSESCSIIDIAELLYNKFISHLWFGFPVPSCGGFSYYISNKEIKWNPIHLQANPEIDELANKIIKEIERLKELGFYG